MLVSKTLKILAAPGYSLLDGLSTGILWYLMVWVLWYSGVGGFPFWKGLAFAAERRCGCSLCWQRWAVIVSCPLDLFIPEKGAESLTLCQWNTAIAKHYFCKTCRIYTHHIRRSYPSVFGVKIGCFDEINIRGYLTTVINDGVSMSLAADHSDGWSF